MRTHFTLSCAFSGWDRHQCWCGPVYWYSVATPPKRVSPVSLYSIQAPGIVALRLRPVPVGVDHQADAMFQVADRQLAKFLRFEMTHSNVKEFREENPALNYTNTFANFLATFVNSHIWWFADKFIVPIWQSRHHFKI